MHLLTTGEIARKLNAERDKVSYALRRMKIAPIGQAGQARVFDESAVALVEKFLNRNKFMEEISSQTGERLEQLKV